MRQPIWLRRDVVVAVQEQLLSAFGGTPGIRDPGLLDSLARPENRFAYQHGVNPFNRAAAYAFGLARNHPFADGNDRIAFTGAAMFLELNGYELKAPESDAVIQTLALAAGELKEAQYAAWLRANAKRRSPKAWKFGTRHAQPQA